MLKVGLTGGIASGKTSVADWFRQKGVLVFDADQAVHRLMNNQEVVDAVRQEFGPVYIQDGIINRAKLGSKVFADQNSKKRLEQLLHPLVLKEMQRQSAEAERRNEGMMIFDIPLLFEVGWDKAVEEVWVVFVPMDIQLKRLIARNGLSSDEAKQRIDAQMSIDEKVKRADRVIDNSGSWQATEAQLNTIWKKICD
jgi:dephospho-CoA kinase